jgi:hypothetical protein
MDWQIHRLWRGFVNLSVAKSRSIGATPSGMSIIMLTSTQFVNFTTADELAHNKVYAIDSAPDGVMWFGTYDSGISQEEY